MKSHGLSVYYSPPNFLFLSVKACYFPSVWKLALGLPWLQTLNCNSLLILSKPIFAGKISGRLFISGQHVGGLYEDQRRPPVVPRLVSKQVQYPALNPLSLTAFSLTLQFES